MVKEKEENKSMGEYGGKSKSNPILIELLRKKLIESGKATRELGDMLQVHHSTVARIMTGERGGGLSNEEVITYLKRLGVTVQQIVSELSPEDAAGIISLLDDDPDRFRTIALAVKKGGSYREHLNRTLDFIKEQMEKEM